MALALHPDRSLRELLSAAALDPALRRRLKTNPAIVLADWGVRAPGRTVYFVEPGEAPAEGCPGDAFIELPPSTPALADASLDVVAGGWDEARDHAAQYVDQAVSAVAWRASDPWSF